MQYVHEIFLIDIVIIIITLCPRKNVHLFIF